MGKERAKQGRAQLFGSLIKANDRDAILALEGEGVDLIHGLNAAVRNGSHPWISFFLERKVKPTPETLVLAIDRGTKAIETILPFVKPDQGHVIAACVARRPELIEHLVGAMRVPVPKNAFEAVVTVERFAKPDTEEDIQKVRECIAVLMRAPSVVRLPARSFQFAMPFIGAEQISSLVKRGGVKINTYRLYEQAVRVANKPIAAYLANYSPLSHMTLMRASLPACRSSKRKPIRFGADTSPSVQIGRVLDECAARRLPEIQPSLASRWAERVLEEIFLNAKGAGRFSDQPQMHARFMKSVHSGRQALPRIIALTSAEDRAKVIESADRFSRDFEAKVRREAEKILGGYRKVDLAHIEEGVVAMADALKQDRAPPFAVSDEPVGPSM